MHWMIPLTLAAGQVPLDTLPASLWAGLIAIILALLAMFKDVLKDMLAGRKPEPTPDPLVVIITDLTRAMADSAQSNGRLADVLERMENAQEKAMDKIGRHMEEQARMLQALDFRTKEILKQQERSAHGD